jgi:hypothetical protein
VIDETTRKYLSESTIAEIVDTNLCFVPKYGRPLSVPKIQRLARSFQLEAIGTVYLSLRSDGQYAILDGQHRIAAARLRGHTKLPALVFIDLSYEQEAALYVKFATVNQQTSLDKFRARIEAHEPMALDIVDVLESIGLHISYSGQVEGGIQAVIVLENLYRKGGRSHLRHVLTTIYRTWQGTPRAYNSQIVNGLSAFLLRYEKLTIADDGVRLDWQRLVSTLAHLTPDGLIAKATQLKGILSQSESNTVVGQVILSEYNRGLKTKRLPDWSREYNR